MGCQGGKQQNKCGIAVVRDIPGNPKMTHSCKAKKGGFNGPGIVPYALNVVNMPDEKGVQTGPVPTNHKELQDTSGGFLLDTDGLVLLQVP